MDADRYVDTTYGELRWVPGRGYRAYCPHPLPHSVDLEPATVTRLATAEAALDQQQRSSLVLTGQSTISPTGLQVACVDDQVCS